MEPPTTSTSGAMGLLYVLAMILSGTMNTVLSKMQYGLRAEGTELCVDPSDPTKLTTLCAFDKPWFSALLAKIGMSLSFVYLVTRHRLRRQSTQRLVISQPLNETARLVPLNGDDTTTNTADDAPLRLPVRTIVYIAWPSLLDLLQTLISNVGLLWVSSSVYQMARGSVVIFSAMVSAQVLHKRIEGYQYASILLVAAAVALVGWAGTSDTAAASPTTSSSNALLGLLLIICAQLITAVQIVAEEFLMTTLHVQPLQLVGIEGLWGLFFYAGLVPALTLSTPGTSVLAKIWHEDFGDSVVKIAHSPALLLLSFLNILAVAALGPSANYVTKHLSGVMRSIAEVLRTLGVWLACLFVFYVVKWRGANSPGEEWTSMSWVELAGFVLMVYGTLAYKKILRLPLAELYYPTDVPAKTGVWVQKPLASSA